MNKAFLPTLLLFLFFSIENGYAKKKFCFSSIWSKFTTWKENSIPPRTRWEVRQRKNRHKITIRMITENDKPVQGSWHCRSGGCSVYTHQLEARIKRGYSLPVEHVVVENHNDLCLIDGTLHPAYSLHHFIVDRALGEAEEIIIDPTYLQFLRKVPEGADPIFIGTRAELLFFFKTHSNLLAYPTLTGNLDPKRSATFVQKIWGFGLSKGTREYTKVH